MADPGGVSLTIPRNGVTCLFYGERNDIAESRGIHAFPLGNSLSILLYLP